MSVYYLIFHSNIDSIYYNYILQLNAHFNNSIIGFLFIFHCVKFTTFQLNVLYICFFFLPLSLSAAFFIIYFAIQFEFNVLVNRFVFFDSLSKKNIV